MASEHRNTALDVTSEQHRVVDKDLYRKIQSAPYRFGFLLTLRRLDCLHSDHPPTGLAKRASDEPLRLGQTPGLDFAPANMHSCELTPDGQRYVLRSRFLGLFGPNAPLPLHLTEYARDRMRKHQDDTFSRFVDLFHHRLLSLFYRAWASGQPTVHLDRPETDRFSSYVAALGGLAPESFRDRDAVSDHAKFHFVGRTAMQPRNAEGLAALMNAFFKMPCEVQQWAGHWMRLPQDCLTQLGRSPESGTLGQSALCGDRVWDTQSKFRLIFGPIDFQQFQRLLPGSPGLKRLIALVRNYIGDELLWDVQLRIRREAIPQTQLGHQGQLGWTAFLTSGTAKADSESAVFTPNY